MRILLTLTIFVFSQPALAQSPIPESEWTELAALFLARSCVAEAGFSSAVTGECGAIAYVYARRFHQMRRAGRYMAFGRVVWHYSAPLRLNRRPWVSDLRDEERPRGMPRMWPWENLLPKWLGMKRFVQQWARGEVENPCPGANHFGSVQDGAPSDWRRIRCNIRTRNRFWRSF